MEMRKIFSRLLVVIVFGSLLPPPGGAADHKKTEIPQGDTLIQIQEKVRLAIDHHFGPEAETWRKALWRKTFLKPLEWLGDHQNVKWARDRYVQNLKVMLENSPGFHSSGRNFTQRNASFILDNARLSCQMIRDGKITEQDVIEAEKEFDEFYDRLFVEIINALKDIDMRISLEDEFRSPVFEAMKQAWKFKDIDWLQNYEGNQNDNKWFPGRILMAAFMAEVLISAREQSQEMHSQAVRSIVFMGKGISAWRRHSGGDEKIFNKVKALIRLQSSRFGRLFTWDMESWFAEAYSMRMGEYGSYETKIEKLSKHDVGEKDSKNYFVIPGVYVKNIIGTSGYFHDK